MTQTEYDIEKSILSTVLFSHHQFKDEEFFNNIELKEENFQLYFHKLVVKQINHNKALSLPYQEEYIGSSLANLGVIEMEYWLSIINANPFGKPLFEIYYAKFVKPKTSLHNRV